ncbi:MAG: SlyX family protein [Planctomycetaceae bacterium]|nr:SlyX family protein [Planctomycetaceae bacterium]MCA9020374.1 SlyX family protein [Planctomycetaceae bacterium]
MTENPSRLEELIARLTQVESVLMHLQHDVEQLDEAVLQQNQIVDTLSKSLKLLDSRLGALEEDGDGPDPVQDKPPHY